MTNSIKEKQLYDMPFNNLIAEAERAIEEGRNDKALMCYQVAEEKSADEAIERKIDLLLKLGVICQLNAMDESAINYYDKAKNLTNKIKDRINYGKINLQIGQIKERNGQWEDALKSYNNACESFTSVDAKEYLGRSYLLIGKLFEKKHWFETSIEWHKKSKKLLDECNNLCGSLLAEIRLSAIYFALGKKEEGEKHLKKCEKGVELETKIPSEPVKKIVALNSIADFYKDLASLYYYLGLWEKALTFFEKSYEIYRKTGYITKKIDTAISLSIIYLNRKNKNKSEELLQIAEESSGLIDENNIPHIYTSLGWAFLRKGNMEKALKYMERAREIAENKRNLYELLETLFGLGKVYLFKGKWLKAGLVYDKVIEISQHLKSLRTLAIAYNNMGNLFTLQGESDKASKFLSIARDIFEKIEHYRGLADCYDNTGLLYRNTGQDDWAFYCMEKSLDIRKRINTAVGLSESYLRLAVFHTEKGQWIIAEDYFEKNLDIWKKANSTLEMDIWNTGMIYYYIKSGQKEKALEIVNDKKLEEELEAINYAQGLKLLYNSRAHFYFTFKEMEKAEDYYQRVLKLTEEQGFVNQIPDALGNLAYFYEESGEIDRALEYLEKKKTLEEELGLKAGIISTYEALSRVYESKAQSIKKDFSHNLPVRSDVISIPPVHPISIEFGRELLPLININRDRTFYERITSIRQHIAEEMGVIVPEIRLMENLHLSPNEYVIKINGVSIIKEKANMGKYLAVGSQEEIKDLPGEQCIEPASELPSVWISEKDLEKAGEKNCIVLDTISAIACNLTEVIRSNTGSFLDRENLYLLLNSFAQKHPVLVNEIYPHTFNLSHIQKVLKNLLKERISIKNIKTILETMADCANVTGDPGELTEYVRMALHRQICAAYATEDNTINFISLDNIIEKTIAEAIQRTSFGFFLIISPDRGQKILSAIGEKTQEVRSRGIEPVILCSPQIRPYLKRLTERSFPKLPVIAHNELPYNYRVNIVATAVMEGE